MAIVRVFVFGLNQLKKALKLILNFVQIEKWHCKVYIYAHFKSLQFMSHLIFEQLVPILFLKMLLLFQLRTLSQSIVLLIQFPPLYSLNVIRLSELEFIHKLVFHRHVVTFQVKVRVLFFAIHALLLLFPFLSLLKLSLVLLLVHKARALMVCALVNVHLQNA